MYHSIIDIWLNVADVTSGTIGCVNEYQMLFLVMAETKTIGSVKIVEEIMSPRHDFSLCDVNVIIYYIFLVLSKQKRNKINQKCSSS